MADEKPRVQTVLECLYEADGPLKPKVIGERIGESAMNVGKDLYDLSIKRGLAEKVADGSWQITSDGRNYVESGGQPKAEPKPEPKPKPTEPTEISDTVPSQADLFRSIGENLGVGAKKGDVRLDALIYYIQRTADLDNLNSDPQKMPNHFPSHLLIKITVTKLEKVLSYRPIYHRLNRNYIPVWMKSQA